MEIKFKSLYSQLSVYILTLFEESWNLNTVFCFLKKYQLSVIILYRSGCYSGDIIFGP